MTETFSYNCFKTSGAINRYVDAINEAVGSIPLLQLDKSFDPVTQPILYGKIENYKEEVEDTGSIFFLGKNESVK